MTSKIAAFFGVPLAAAVAFNIVGGVLIGLAAYAALEEPLRKLLNRKPPKVAPFVTS